MELISKWTTRSSTGVISKGLYHIQGKEYIVKGSSRRGKEPLSEYFASKVFALFMDTVNYSILPADRFPEIKQWDCGFVSVCKKLPYNLTQFYKLLQNLEGPNRGSLKFLINKMDEYGLDKERLYKLFIIDALVGNQDRHWNNVDVTQCDNGIQWAPALDFGASLLFNISDEDLILYDKENIGPDKSRPIGDTHKDNIKYAQEKLEVPKRVLPEVYLWDITKVLEIAYAVLPKGACSEKRFASLKSYIEARYPIYIEPYIK